MANKIFNIRVKNKRDTEANWKSKNPVLLDGEIIIVTTTSGDTRFKVGDGKKTYNQLPFQDQKTRDLIPSVDSSLSSTSTNPVQNKIIKSELDKKAERDVVNTTTNGLMSVADKKKLDGIAAGANKITVDTSLSSTSTNPVQNKIINSALSGKAGTSVATTDANGLMSAADKKKLDGIAAGANKITVDTSLSSTSTNPVQNKIINSALSGKAGTSVATTDANGLMSAADKKKLDGIADGANKTDVDSFLSSGSIRPVQNRVVKSELDNKLDKSGGTLTGNLTGKYIAGTWLRTTNATDFGKKPGKIAILDDSGWIYYRTPSELLSDIGGVAINNFIDTIYPLGSIYITTSNTAPMSLFPGTYWLPIYDRFLLGGGSGYKAGSTGGEATHTLTKNEMPNHRHIIWFPNDGGEQSAEIGYPAAGSKKTYYAEASKTADAGGGAAHNNMPPYLAVYIWKRVTFDEYEAGADGG